MEKNGTFWTEKNAVPNPALWHPAILSSCLHDILQYCPHVCVTACNTVILSTLHPAILSFCLHAILQYCHPEKHDIMQYCHPAHTVKTSFNTFILHNLSSCTTWHLAILSTCLHDIRHYTVILSAWHPTILSSSNPAKSLPYWVSVAENTSLTKN